MSNEFRSAIEAHDLEGLATVLSEDIVFRSPIVYAPYQGREAVLHLLRAVAQVFEDLKYTREIGAEDQADHALVFTARIGEREIEGCDFLHTDEHGLVDELYVMVRPMSGAMALAEAMTRQLALTTSGEPVS
jgi:SnoaL-like protein